MTDHELEQRLRDFYRDEIGDAPVPPALAARVTAIPTTVPAPASVLGSRRLVLLAAAALLAALLGGAIAVGSGLVRLPWTVEPVPRFLSVDPNSTNCPGMAHEDDATVGGGWTAGPAGLASEVKPGLIAAFEVSRWAAVDFQDYSSAVRDADIVLLDPSTGAACRLVRFSADKDMAEQSWAWYRRPVWSPDGTALAFLVETTDGPRCRDLYVWSRAGLVRPASDMICSFPDGGFAWSPDGSQIAVAGHRSIVLISAEGGPSHSLPCAACLTGPIWSPDGSRVAVSGNSGAVVASLDDKKTTALAGTKDLVPIRWLDDDTLFAVDIDEELLFSIEVDGRGKVAEYASAHRYWYGSPDMELGTSLACGSGRWPAHCDLEIVDFDDGTTRTIASGPFLRQSYQLWAPDSRSVAFTMFLESWEGRQGGGGRTPGDGLWLVNRDGTGLRQLTADPLFPEAWQPVWE